MSPSAPLPAGQRRARHRLSASLVRWRCLSCLSDARYPSATADGIVCPYCAVVDASRPVRLEQIGTASGTRWVATIGDQQ